MVKARPPIIIHSPRVPLTRNSRVCARAGSAEQAQRLHSEDNSGPVRTPLAMHTPGVTGHSTNMACARLLLRSEDEQSQRKTSAAQRRSFFGQLTMGAPDFRHVLRFEPAMPREHLHIPWQPTLFSLASAGRCSTIAQRTRDLMMPLGLAFAPTTLNAEN